MIDDNWPTEIMAQLAISSKQVLRMMDRCSFS
jgi:hypothetical protein